MKVVNCRVNQLVDPVGFDLTDPVFSWVLEETDLDPFALRERIIIEREGEQIFSSPMAVHDPRAAKMNVSLEPGSFYRWKLDIEGYGMFPCGSFITGKMGESWKGKWITPEKTLKSHPCFFKEIKRNPGKKITSALLFLSGLGLYEAYLDGRKIGDEFLAPGCTAYEEWTQIQTYDVTEMIRTAEELSVLVGSGWYKGRYGFHWKKEEADKKPLCMIAELRIVYEDRTTQMIVSDDSWKVRESGILQSGIYYGEEIDDRIRKEVSAVRIISSPVRTLTDRLSLPIRVRETFFPRIVPTGNGELVVDSGQNLSGIFELNIHEPEGTRIRLDVGEVLQDGNFYRDNLRTAEAVFLYTSDGKEKKVRPHFTFYGFRYIRISGISDFREEDLQVKALCSDVTECGKMETGHAGINRLISNVRWGMYSNFLDIPTDCPQRDERMGWTGDAQVFSQTALFLSGAYPFYRKYLKDMEIEQDLQGGKVPDTVPAEGCTGASAVWGDSCCIIPWNMYLFTGDRSILEKHFPYMEKWLAYVDAVDGKDHGWRNVFQYGDWLALDGPFPGPQQVKGGTDEGFIADVYHRKSLLITAETAELLGFFRKAEDYRKKAETILHDIREEYYSPSGRCCIPTQTAAVLTLSEHLTEEEGTKKACAALKQLLEYREGKLSTGFTGTPFLCPALADNGMVREAFRLLLNRSYPGWLYEVDQGATTIWERWNSLDETGHISGTGMNSLNHYSYGSIAEFLWKYVAGLEPVPEEPGFRKVRFHPLASVKLSGLRAEYPSASGTYRIFWEFQNRRNIRIEISVPAGCLAEVKLPFRKDPVSTVCAGHHCFEYEADPSWFPVYTVDDILKDILTDDDAVQILKEECPRLEEYKLWGRDYPLRETMNNLGDGNMELFDRINLRLSRI